ncbi:MAG: TraR/DksA family transcriptional regulator [Pirellula sp.]|jgi:RNA polymerase-binding transcription factor DksA|nr:TraR/DksA family transcriptional regulator [Pirellula sp.]
MSKDHSEIRALLEGKLKELEERAQRLENRLSQPGEADSEENAILRENDEVLEGLNDLTVHDIHQIRLALDRIEHGTYGLCTECGRAIAKARLNALPFTSTCVECAR